MGFKSESVLRERALSFTEALSEHSIRGDLLEGSFRDYQVKIAIAFEGRAWGKVNLYHSPKRQAFTLRTHELRDDAAARRIKSIWDESLSPSSVREGWQIYVDGSYQDGLIGYGFVVLCDGERVDESCGRVEDGRFQGMNQIGGELVAVCRAVRWCLDHEVSGVTIAYDYEGIEKWATGQWQANKPGTRVYYRAAQDWSVDIRWQKIASHSGDYWNDYADRLAKRGASVEESLLQADIDPVEEARRHAEAFVDFLRDHGVSASYQGELDDQFARIAFDRQPGYVDIYNTDRRSWNRPYCHGFIEAAFGKRIEALFRRFLSDGSEREGARRDSGEDRFRVVSYYYRTLKLYRDCRFDFVDLAESLADAFEQIGQSALRIEEIRYDFEELERLYCRLRKETQ